MKKLFFSAGDLSGDFHASILAAELLKRHPDWQISALGGAKIRASGAQMLGDTSEMGVIGFASALAILPQTLKLRRNALKWLEANRPDAAILCDWGGFNARLLPELKRLNVPVLYYFPPRSWQKSGEGGLSVAPLCHTIATPFEWSVKRLNDAGGHAIWVGHPLLETATNCAPRQAVRAELGVRDDQKLIALLPGSRALERRYIAPHVAGAVEILKSRFDAQFCVAATAGTSIQLRKLFASDVQILENRTFDLLGACDAAIVKSGTSTLEAAVADAPQVVVYEVPAVVHAQVKVTGLRRRIPFVAMPNIILGRGAVTELLADDCRAPKIADAVMKLLENGEENARLKADYALVRDALGAQLPYTATHRTADLVEEMVGN